MNTLLVTNTNDSGEGSLRRAIEQANACLGDDIPTITFDPTLAGQTIALASDLSLTHAARIVNLADSPVAIEGYSLKTNADLHLENMILPKVTVSRAIVLTGSNNTLTGNGEVIRLENANVDLSAFHADATTLAEEGADIGIWGHAVNEETHYVKLGKGLSTYRLAGFVSIEEGVDLYLDDGVILKSDHPSSDIHVQKNARLIASKAEIDLMGHGEANGGSLSQLIVEDGGIVDLNASTVKAFNATVNSSSAGSVGWYTNYNLHVRPGGLLRLKDSRFTDVNFFKVEKGGTVEIVHTVVQNLETAGETFLRETTIEKTLTVHDGAQLSGSNNTFTGTGAVIELRQINIDLSGFEGKAEQNGAYLNVIGNKIDGRAVYTKLGDGLSTYRFNSDIDIQKEGSLEMGAGTVLAMDRTFRVYGRLSFSEGSHIQLDRPIHFYEGATFSANGVLFSSPELAVLHNWAGDTDLLWSNFRKNALPGEAYVTVNGLSGDTILRSIAEGVAYQFEADTTIGSNLTVEIDKSVTARFDHLDLSGCIRAGEESDISIKSLILRGNAQLSGNQITIANDIVLNDWNGDVGSFLANLGDAVFEDIDCVRIHYAQKDLTLCALPEELGYYKMVFSDYEERGTSPISVISARVSLQKGAVLRIASDSNYWGRIRQTYLYGNLICEEGSRLEVGSTNGGLLVQAGGHLSMEKAVLDGTVKIFQGGAFDSHGCRFISETVLELNSWAGDTSMLTGSFSEAVFDRALPYIDLAGIAGDVALSAINNDQIVYRAASGFSLAKERVLTLDSGSVFDGNNGEYGGTLECREGSTLKGYCHIVNDGRLLSSGCNIQGNVTVRAGGTSTWTRTSFQHAVLTFQTGSDNQLTGCSGEGLLNLSVGASVNAHGNDFSRMSISITGSQAGDNMIDLSGNYWGTADLDEIMSKISGDTSRVVINDWLLVDPTVNFIYLNTSLRNCSIGLGTNGFDIELSHEIDAASVSADNVRLVDENGNELKLTEISVSGKTIHVEFDPLEKETAFRLLLGDDIRDMEGAALVNATGLPFAAQIEVDLIAPRVSHLEPGGDFTGVLSELKIYFTDAVDAATLKEGVTILDPQGRRVAVRQVTELGGNAYALAVDPQTVYGSYTVTVGTDVMDMAGNRLNQNGNATPGEADDGYTGGFSIADVDLTITDVRRSGSLNSGETAVISWAGENATGYELRGSWTDGVYLSKDNRWDVGDILLGSYAHSGGLPAGTSYTGSLEINWPGVLPGDYFILVRSDMFGQEQADKESAAWAQNLMAVPVTVAVPEAKVGDTWTGRMTSADSSDVLVIRRESGQSLKLTLDSSVSSANMEVFVGSGRIPTRESYDLALQQGKSGGSLVIPSRQGGGDVYVLINNKSSAVALDYSLDVAVLPMTVTSVTPTTQGQNSSSTFDIYGVNFTPETRVVLVDAEGNEYVPDDLNVISSERIRIKYDALRLPAEKLDVAVRSETENVTLPDVVTISSASGAHLKIAKIFPNVLGYHIQSVLKLLYENTGTDPMHAPLISLTGKQNGKPGAIMTMDPSIVNQGFWTSAMPEGFANTVSFLAYSPGTPGWVMPTGRDEQVNEQMNKGYSSLEDWLWYRQNARLVHSGDGYQVSMLNDPSVLSRERPKFGNSASIGGRAARAGGLQPHSFEIPYANYLGNTINVYYCGWQQPWDFDYPDFHFELGYLGTDNTSPLNWYDSFSYTDMPSELKRALADSLTQSAGDTWGDYVLMLNKNLIYLDELGCVSANGNSTFDTDSLVEFELMKANGTTTPAKTLASSVDMSVETPGLALGVARVYRNDITSRFEEGAFGYGWTFNWDVDLTFREDGTVVMNAPGAQRVYQPDYRGGYVNASGDHAELKRLKDGSWQLTEREGLVWSFANDGKLVSQIDANGNTITCAYNEAGQLVRLTHSNGEFIALEWNADGHMARLSDTRGDTVTYDYADGHLVKATDQFGESVQYAYSDTFAHALISVVGTDGVASEFTYDRQGLLRDSSLSSADKGVTGYGQVTLTYGDNGEVTATDVYGASSTYYYDNKGLVRKAVDVNGNTLRYGYDDKGNMSWVTDQSGNTSSFSYDAYGNLTSATNALGHTTTYTYTEQNNLDVLTDALGHAIDYDYDARGNMTSITYADGSVESWTYDAVGNAEAWTNRRGKTVRSEYDAAGRVTARHYEDGTSMRFAYDARGNMLTAEDSTGITRYAYDEKDRVIRIEQSNGHTLAYTYDERGQRASMTDDRGNVTRYAYNAMGLLERVTDGDGLLLVAYAYDRGGRLTHEERGNGTATDYAYTLAGQVETVTTRDASGEVTQFCSYTYNEVGLRTSMSTQDGTWTYAYDKIGQLTHAVFAPAPGSAMEAQEFAYEYDAAGNRTRSVVNGVETRYEVNNLNQTLAAGDAAYAFDADGNMISKTDASGVTVYTWNDDNQLVGVRTSTGDVYAYAYNAFGDRVSVTVNGKTTEYLYDPAGYGNLAAEYDAASGEQNRTYTHGNGLVGFDDAMEGRYWYQNDALGSVTGITDGSGQLVATYAYDPFGGLLAQSGTVNNPFQWVGTWGLTAEGTGLTYMRARSYDPATGKFISADPIGVNGGENLYAYCGNNPVEGLDPSGYGQFGYYGEDAGLPGNLKFNHAYYRYDDGTTIAFGPNISDMGSNLWNFGLLGLAYPATGNFIHNDPLADKYGKTRGGSYDDDIMRKAADNVMKDPRWKMYLLTGNNCQDFTEALEKEYWKGWLVKHASEAWDVLDADNAYNLNSHDPNDLVGPSGYGERNFIAGGQQMPFMIRFENEEKATAPTRWMRVFNTLDDSYDLDSFTLDSFYLAGNLIEMTEKQDSFNRKLTLNFNGEDVLVDVKINLNREERRLEAEFMAIDPATGTMLQDPGVGMLFPNDATGRGDGYITYTIETRGDLASGATVGNAADIYFDFNEVIPTPELSYTIDALAPGSSVLTAADTGVNGEALLTWEGADDADGSGVAAWYVYVSKDGGAFTFWKSFDADTTSATFAGTENGLYGFYVLAVDNVGNVEKEKTAAEASVTLSSSDGTPPDLVTDLKAVSQGGVTVFAWKTVDDPSGVSYVLEYADNVAWNDSKQIMVRENYTSVEGLADGIWYWRVKAVDGVGNASGWTQADPLSVDATAPDIPVESLNVESRGTAAKFIWTAVTDPSGIAGYLVQYALNGKFDSASTKQVQGTEYIDFDLAGNATYYWRVAAVDKLGNVGAWAEGTPFITTVAVDDNSPLKATQLALTDDYAATASEWVGFGDKADYFKVTPSASGSFRVGLERVLQESHVYLSIGTLDEKGGFSSLRTLAVGPESPLMEMDGIAMEAGRDYYIRVMAYDSGAGVYNGTYQLNVKGTVPEAGNITDNNDAGRASVLELADRGDARASGWVGYGDVTDFYRFELFDGGQVNLKLSDMQMAVRMNLFQKNDQGGLSQVSARSVRSSGMEEALNLAAGTYYVQVQSYDDGAGRYNTGYMLDIDAGEQAHRPGYLVSL